jgi:hypothetical protein
MRAQPDFQSLSARERAILDDLQRVRLLTGQQLERLHFAGLHTSNAQGSARRRSLGRLQVVQLVTALPRRVGSERAGSAGLVYTLDAHAVRSLSRLNLDAATPHRARRPWAIGWPFVQHTLDVAELYVRLRELERTGSFKLQQFAAEPASWFTTPYGTLKPDARAVYETADWEEHWWLEVDRGTESLPTLRRKLLAYVEFANAHESGPGGVVPRVMVTVRTEKRAGDLRNLVDSLPVPAAQLVTIQRFEDVFVVRPPP